MLFSMIMVGLTFASCTDDVDDQEARWYLSGTWQSMQYPDEIMVFYMDGTGYWQDTYTGDYEDFDYYCNGDVLWFTWYPPYDPAYNERCLIYTTNPNAMQITYPSGSHYGGVTIYYSRIN